MFTGFGIGAFILGMASDYEWNRNELKVFSLRDGVPPIPLSRVAIDRVEVCEFTVMGKESRAFGG